MKIFKTLFIFWIGFSIFWSLYQAPWEAHLRSPLPGDITDTGTWIIGLKPSPVWNPPESPYYIEYAQVFSDLSFERSENTRIITVLKWDWLVMDIVLYIWFTTTVFGLLSFVIQANKRDCMIHFIRWIGVGLTISAGACILLWILKGGWGLPSPLLFAGVGFLIGIYKGWTHWRRDGIVGEWSGALRMSTSKSSTGSSSLFIFQKEKLPLVNPWYFEV